MADEPFGAFGFQIPADRMNEARSAFAWLIERNPENLFFPPNNFIVADRETTKALRERFGLPEPE